MIDASKVGTVHVYCEDRLFIGVSLPADGNHVVSPTLHNISLPL
jgi:hypothetical protein